MVAALVITFLYVFVVWLFFFKLQVAKFNVIWGLVTFWIGVHLLLVFLIGTRFSQPYTKDARIVRRTIQIVPRLPEPTLLKEVVVEPNVTVSKGDPLFRFDDTLYRQRVAGFEAELVAAKQNVLVLQADIDAANDAILKDEADIKYAQQQVNRYRDMSKKGAARQEDLDQWRDKLAEAQASLGVDQANLKKAQLQYNSQINGVNTSVAQVQSKLDQARYYLNQTVIYAPEDGFITNLQAQPGLVVGTRRIGAIASFIVDSDPYLLGTYFQEHLKFVKPGQPVEIALDMHPGEIFTGTVESIWWATGQGQLMPKGEIPQFVHKQVKGRFAVKIRFDEEEKLRLPAGAQGAAAIYTDVGKGFSPLRRVVIRTYTWANWLYPLPI
ncbi:MAG: HlyD family secretion protein [Gammaproteobacteria bacterium]|jgi:multidrug resistance efflux pump|nr:HlyD family secretion protein [Gammaproteobacteria bacterium]